MHWWWDYEDLVAEDSERVSMDIEAPERFNYPVGFYPLKERGKAVQNLGKWELTGEVRLRRGWFGRLILQVHETMQVQGADGRATVFDVRKRWRDAREDDGADPYAVTWSQGRRDRCYGDGIQTTGSGARPAPPRR